MNSYHFVLNNATNNSRVLKISKSLLNYDLCKKVYVIGIWEKGLNQEEWVDQNRCILRFKTPLRILMGRNFLIKPSLIRKFISYINKYFYYFKIANFLLGRKVDFVSCHHVNLLPILVFLKFFKRFKLIYTPHELESEKTGIGRFEKLKAKCIEKVFIKIPEEILVVCDPIALWYKNKYNLKQVHVLRNIPLVEITNKTNEKRSSILKEKFKIPKEEILYIYQGVLSGGRDLDELLDIFVNHTDKHIVLMGYGVKANQIKQLEKLHSNIHFYDAVPMEKIIEVTSSADVGLFYLINKTSMSYEFSLPNKYSEYLLAGLPVIVSTRTTYLSDLVIANKCGWSISPNKSDLINLVNTITWKDLNDFEPFIHNYTKNLGWQFEDSVLKKIFIR